MSSAIEVLSLMALRIRLRAADDRIGVSRSTQSMHVRARATLRTPTQEHVK